MCELNIDVGHGVIESELINRLNYLEDNDILIDKKIWHLKDANVYKYYNIITKILKDLSIVHALICSSLDGYVGYYLPPILKSRISKSHVYLSTLTRTFCTFDMNKLINTILYIDELNLNMTIEDVDCAIENFLLTKN